jgi:hypothetical protein
MNEAEQDPPSAEGAERLNEDVGLAPADALDPLIEAFKKDVDRTLLRENLKLTPQQRSEKFVSFMKSVWQLRAVAKREQRR